MQAHAANNCTQLTGTGAIRHMTLSHDTHPSLASQREVNTCWGHPKIGPTAFGAKQSAAIAAHSRSNCESLALPMDDNFFPQSLSEYGLFLLTILIRHLPVLLISLLMTVSRAGDPTAARRSVFDATLLAKLEIPQEAAVLAGYVGLRLDGSGRLSFMVRLASAGSQVLTEEVVIQRVLRSDPQHRVPA